MNLWHHLSRRRQKQFYLLVILMIMGSISEVISLGAVVPFLGTLTAPDQVFNHRLMQPFIEALNITKPNQLILPITIAFIALTILAGIVRLALLYVMTRISYATGAELSINIYRRTLYQEYSVHVARNSSEVINGIITKTSTAIGVITSFLTLMSSIILLFGIIGALLVIHFQIALIASIGFGLLYWMVTLYTRKQLGQNSQVIANQSTLMIKSLHEGLGGIRDVLIDGSQNLYTQIYRNADLPLRKASGDNAFIAGSPRFIMEGIGMALIALLAYTLTLQPGGINNAIPVLGVLALGAQRLLPAMQQTYASYSSIKGARSSLNDILKLLEQPLPDYADQPISMPIPFLKEIELKNLSFRYTKQGPWVLEGINLKLPKGGRIGFVGATGSGKSTLLDIIMGLLPPTDGELLIDNQPVNHRNKRAWQLHIAHVPQNIFLSDCSIEENIAFSVPKNQIDHQQVKIVTKLAQMTEVIEQLPDGYKTIVGEQGVRLSGGQRQRIGIARALYKGANVIILDEATSSLDNETEQLVMQAIEKLGREITILIIAHRLTTLKGCDQIISLDKNSREIEILRYEDIIGFESKKQGE
jgi:ATP-binding cassette, subfamily B, bacterial PglK